MERSYARSEADGAIEVSRSKRARAKERKRAAVRPVAQPAAVESSRLAPARRRAQAAKVAICAAAVVSVGASMATPKPAPRAT